MLWQRTTCNCSEWKIYKNNFFHSLHFFFLLQHLKKKRVLDLFKYCSQHTLHYGHLAKLGRGWAFDHSFKQCRHQYPIVHPIPSHPRLTDQIVFAQCTLADCTSTAFLEGVIKENWLLLLKMHNSHFCCASQNFAKIATQYFPLKSTLLLTACWPWYC